MKITPKQHIYSPLNNIFFGRGGLNSKLIFKALDLGDTSAWKTFIQDSALSDPNTVGYARDANLGLIDSYALYKYLQSMDATGNRVLTDEDLGNLKYNTKHAEGESSPNNYSGSDLGDIKFDKNLVSEDYMKELAALHSQQWYKEMTKDLTAADSSIRNLWITDTDMYLPDNHELSLTGKTFVTTGENAFNVQGTTYNSIPDYLEFSRGDTDPYGVHNSHYFNTRAVYYYRDVDGNKHYLSNPGSFETGETTRYIDSQGNITNETEVIPPDQAQTTTTSDVLTPPPATGNTRSTGGEDNGKGGPHAPVFESNQENGKHRNYGAFWGKMYKAGLSALPTLMDVGKLWNTIRNNNKVAEEYLKALHPLLKLTYERYSPVTGNFSARLYYNQEAADVRRRAARNATADASTNLAAQLEANRLANQYEEKGFLTDDQLILKTAQEALARLEDNAKRRSEIANENMKNIQDVNYQRAGIKAQRRQQNTESLNNFIDSLKLRREDAAAKKEKQNENLQNLYITNEEKRLNAELEELWYKYVEEYNADKEEKDKLSVYSPNAKLYNPWYKAQQAKIREYIQGLIWAALSGKLNVKAPNSLSSVNWDDYKPYLNPTSEKLGGKLQLMQRGGAFPGFVTATFNVPKQSAPKEEAIKTKAPSKDEITIKDIIDLVKNANLLPNEESAILAELKADIGLASLTGMGISDIASKYVQIMDLVNNAKYNKEEYSSAKKTVESNSALDDIAMLPNGNILVLPTEGENKGLIIAITAQQYAQLKNTGLFNTVTNSNLLYLRAKDNSYINNNNIFLILQNGVGLSKVYLTIKDNINAVADLRTSQHYYAKGSAEDKALLGLAELAGLKDSLTPEEYQLLELNYQQSIALLKLLEGNLAEGPAGSYLITNTVKGVLDPDKVKAALTYLWDVLPYNQRNRLIAETLSGTEDEAKLLIMQYMIAGVPTSSSETYSPVDPLGSRGGSGGSGGTGSNSNLNMNRALLALLGYGPKKLIVFNAGDQKTVITQGVKVTNPEGLGPTPLLSSYLGNSEMASVVNTGQGLSLNGIPIGVADSYNVMLKDQEAYVVAYPSHDENGHIVPLVTKENRQKVEEADKEIKESGINIYDPEDRKKHYAQLNEIYRKHGLQDAYDSNGNLVDGWSYFLVANVYIANNLLPKNVKDDLSHNELFKEVDERTRSNMIARGEHYINDPTFNNGFWWWQNDKVYEGLVWMAMDVDDNYINSALGANNKSLHTDDALNVDILDQTATIVNNTTRSINNDGVPNLRAGE